MAESLLETLVFFVYALGVVPLLVGRGIVRQATGVDRETALRVAVTSWPLALAGSFALWRYLR